MRILIVDDELSFLEVLKWMLEDKGHQVMTVSGANLAYQKLKENRFDLILSDLQMAQGTGVELLEHCSREKIKTPIILMSGFFNLPKSELLEKGATEVLTKPIDFKKFDKIIAQVVR